MLAEEAWDEIRRRRTGEVAGEDNEMPDNFLEVSGDDRRRLRPEKEENGEEREGLSARIEQLEEIAAIFASRRNSKTQEKSVFLGALLGLYALLTRSV